MIKITKDNDDENEISPWEQSPIKKSRLMKRLIIKKKESPRQKLTPYRPRAIQTRNLKSNDKNVAVQSIIFNVPMKTNAFPYRRITSPGRILKKLLNRSRSCAAEEISISDIETIERKQRLLPYRPYLPYNGKNENRKNPMSFDVNDSILSLGIVKESLSKTLNYRKYNRRKS